MFGVGMPELMVVLILALVVFGAGRLPEVGRSLGKAIRGFKEAVEEKAKEPPPAAPPALVSHPVPVCAACGKPPPAEAAFCPSCGERVRPERTQASEARPT